MTHASSLSDLHGIFRTAIIVRSYGNPVFYDTVYSCGISTNFHRHFLNSTIRNHMIPIQYIYILNSTLYTDIKKTINRFTTNILLFKKKTRLTKNIVVIDELIACFVSSRRQLKQAMFVVFPHVLNKIV